MSDIIDRSFDIIIQDVRDLIKKDPVFSKAFPQDYKVSHRKERADMAAMLRIIIGQQLSTKAAAALWQKFIDRFDPNDAPAILKADEDDLKACGFSRQKIGYVRHLTQKICDGDVDVTTWRFLSDDEVYAQIIALKGFGPWSAHIFLMFSLYARHVWPAGDLGIQIGLQRYYNLNERPNETQAKNMVKDFKGQETAAAFLLWDLKEGYAQ